MTGAYDERAATVTRKRKYVDSKEGVVEAPPMKSKEVQEVETGEAEANVVEIPSELRSQYNDLCAEVLIPDDEFQSATLLMNKLENELVKKYPNLKLYMLRNWYLQLRGFGGDDGIRFYIDFQGRLSGCPDFRTTGTKVSPDRQERDEAVQAVINCFRANNIKKHRPTSTTTTTPTDKDKPHEKCYLDPQSGLKFGVDTHAWLLLEVQSCRLLSYLVMFDPRIKPLLAVVTYWSRVNNIVWSSNNTKVKLFIFIPEPAVLHWLVMLFLCHMRVIPTPREITTENVRTCQTIVKGKHGSDMGFSYDEAYALQQRNSKAGSLPPEDSDDFLIDVITLAKDFFSYFAKLGARGSWILNARDGEVLSKAAFRSEAPHPSSFSTRLTVEEMSNLMSLRYKSTE